MTEADLDVDFFPHSRLYLCCFPQNAYLCDPDLRPRSPRTKVGFCCGPAGRSLCPSSPGQAPSLLSAARGHLHASCVPSRASPVLQPGAATLGPGQTVSLSPGGGASGQVHLHRRALARRPWLGPGSSQAWTLEPPSLVLRRAPVLLRGPKLRRPPILLQGPKLRRPPVLPQGPKLRT